MARRHSLSASKSRRAFAGNSGTHPKNRATGNPMRGGIRL